MVFTTTVKCFKHTKIMKQIPTELPLNFKKKRLITAVTEASRLTPDSLSVFLEGTGILSVMFITVRTVYEFLPPI